MWNLYDLKRVRLKKNQGDNIHPKINFLSVFGKFGDNEYLEVIINFLYNNFIILIL